MEHINITDLGNGYFKLVPEKGYRLMIKGSDGKYYSEAITKTPEKFVAVPVE